VIDRTEDPMPFACQPTRRIAGIHPRVNSCPVVRFPAPLLLLLLIAFPPLARGGDPIEGLLKGPLIRLDRRAIDFGRIPQHVKRTDSFTISNAGTEPLRLLKVTPDCGCTLAEAADTVIAPGASTTLRVNFLSGNYEGEQRKVVILETNDPAEPRIDLLVKSYVAPEIDVSERILNFGPVRRGQTPVLQTTLTAEAGVPFTVLQPTDGTDLVEWTAKQDPQKGPGSWVLEGRIRPDAPFGRFNVRVSIPVKHPKRESDRISIRGFIHGYYRPVDPGINFGESTAGRVLSRTLRIQADGPGDYKITGTRTSVPWLTTTLKRDDRDYLLTVYLNSKEPTRVRETVTVLSTDPEQPELVIDVRATVR
jgi:hypothetical protein